MGSTGLKVARKQLHKAALDYALSRSSIDAFTLQTVAVEFSKATSTHLAMSQNPNDPIETYMGERNREATYKRAGIDKLT